MKDIPGNNGLMGPESWLMFEEIRFKKAFHLPGNEGAKVRRWTCA